MALDKSQSVPKYNPSKTEQETLSKVSQDFLDAKSLKNRNYRQINILGKEYDLETWWRLLRDHFNGRVDDNADVDDDWKSKHFKKRTRHKVIATIAQAQAANIGVDFEAVNRKNDVDRVMSRVSEDLYDWSLEREEFDLKMLQADLVRAIEGTVHIYEEIAHDMKVEKEIVSMDMETGQIEWEEKEVVEFAGPRCEVVPNVEIYPGDIWTSDVQAQPYIIRRRVTTYENAELMFGKYKAWKFVEKGERNFIGQDDESEKDEDDNDMDSNDVEVIYYWRKSPELFAIVVNGVLLTQPDHPIPNVHKRKTPYPFAKGIAEPFADIRFYWGNSVVNNNYSEQELVNEIYRMVIDSTKLAIKPPVYTNNAELAGTDLVRPGVMATIGDDEKIDTIGAFSNVNLSAAYNLLDASQGQMDENSLSPIVSGQQQEGVNTATEVSAIVGSAQKLQGVNEQFYGSLLVQHAKMRIANMFWFLAHNDDVERIVRPGVKVKGGKAGKREIIFIDALQLPQGNAELSITGEPISNAELSVFNEEKKRKKKGEDTEITMVPRQIINNYEFYVSMSPVPKPSRRSVARLTEIVNKYRLYAPNPQIDQTKNTEMLIEAMGDNPDELLMKQPAGMPGPEQTPLPPQAPAPQQAQLATQIV